MRRRMIVIAAGLVVAAALAVGGVAGRRQVTRRPLSDDTRTKAVRPHWRMSAAAPVEIEPRRGAAYGVESPPRRRSAVEVQLDEFVIGGRRRSDGVGRR